MPSISEGALMAVNKNGVQVLDLATKVNKQMLNLKSFLLLLYSISQIFKSLECAVHARFRFCFAINFMSLYKLIATIQRNSWMIILHKFFFNVFNRIFKL